MILYWGVRDERDLYARAALEEMARRAANFRWVPVLSEPSPGWAGRRGWVHEAVLGDIEQLARYEVYASGPPAMIEAVRREFALRGVPPTRLAVRFLRLCARFARAPADDGLHQVLIFGRLCLQQRSR